MNKKARGLNRNPLFTKTEHTESKTETDAVATEDTMAAQPAATPDAAPLSPEETAADTAPRSETAVQHLSIDESTGPLAERATNQSSSPSRDRSTEQSTEQLLAPSDALPTKLTTRPVLDRPTAFYLFVDQSDALDAVVTRLKKEYKLKTDRSALLRAILTEPVLDFYDETTHAELCQRILQQSMSRLVSR